jgi:hypothetical protein
MAVELVLSVTRSDDDRLTGNVRLADKDDRREFSGTLELLSVFEQLVPTEGQRQQAKGVRRA